MGVDIAGLGLIFLAAVAGFIPGALTGIGIVSHRNYAAWKRRKKQVQKQIKNSRKILERLKKKDIKKQKKEFEKEKKRQRKEEIQKENQKRKAERKASREAEREARDRNKSLANDEPLNREGAAENESRKEQKQKKPEIKFTPADSIPKEQRKPRKGKKNSLLESRMQTCLSDMSFECAENGTSEKDIAREYQKKQDDAYRI